MLRVRLSWLCSHACSELSFSRKSNNWVQEDCDQIYQYNVESGKFELWWLDFQN